MAPQVPAWKIYLAFHAPMTDDQCEWDDALSNVESFDGRADVDVDTLTASDVDPVAYMEHDSCASLDDTIEASERFIWNPTGSL